MADLSGQGVAVRSPPGWDGRIYRRREEGERITGAPVEPGGASVTTHSVLHAANFPLPDQRGDFGSGAVEIMGAEDVLVILFEFHPDSARTALFAQQGLPLPLGTDCFSPNTLQRALPGQAGTQFFFSSGGRAYTLYVVLGSYANRFALVSLANSVRETVQIAPLAASG